MVITRFVSSSLAVVLTFTLGFASAQTAAADADPFDGRLLPVELVMAFRTKIDLTEEQNAKIGALVVELQQGIAGKQWKMQTAYFDLIEVLDQPRLDEQRALDLAKQAIDTENEIKLEQLRLLIRLRNLLTNEQVAFLRQRLAEGWKKE
jgi:Spy/CpxP family protein refolding chaperone